MRVAEEDGNYAAARTNVIIKWSRDETRAGQGSSRRVGTERCELTEESSLSITTATKTMRKKTPPPSRDTYRSHRSSRLACCSYSRHLALNDPAEIIASFITPPFLHVVRYCLAITAHISILVKRRVP